MYSFGVQTLEGFVTFASLFCITFLDSSGSTNRCLFGCVNHTLLHSSLSLMYCMKTGIGVIMGCLDTTLNHNAFFLEVHQLILLRRHPWFLL
jgi:uncharacterized membrane protein YqgA involved in biofilm formation